MRLQGTTIAVIGMLLGASFLSATGCAYCSRKKPAPAEASQIAVPPPFYQTNWGPQEVPSARLVARDYRLRPGDQVEIIYHVRQRRATAYRIKIQDVIEIRFPFNPGRTQIDQVQSDGTLHLDIVGPIFVLDRTIDELHDELQKRYSVYLKDPTLTVTFKESNVAIQELKEAIKTAPRGMSRLVPVTPDGTISLPFIVDVRAEGLTIGQLHQELNRAYHEIGINELEVTVNLETVAPISVYVFGEVRIPGALLNKTGAVSSSGHLTLLQAIAQSGGYIPARADLSSVLLIRRQNLPKPEHAIINVYQLLETRSKEAGKPVVSDASKSRYDIWLEEGDIIYVPTTDIAKRADYIDYVWTRGIRAVGGFTSSAVYSVSDTVDWLGPNP